MDDYRVDDIIVEQTDADMSAAYALISSAMTMGIVSCALCWAPFASIAGIILGFMGKKKVEAGTAMYVEANQPIPGKRIPARILTLVGGITGIVMTVFWAIYIIAICAACAAYGCR